MTRIGRLFLLISFALSAHSLFADPKIKEDEIFDLSRQSVYENQIIDSITFKGLKWTKDRAARWLLSQHVGEPYNHEHWLIGIHKLYDTGILYDVTTNITPAKLAGHIDIEVQVKDRWSLLPFGIAQAGGGSNQIGGGVFDNNAFGYFAQLAAGFSTLNNVTSYDLNYFQEFVADTDYMLGLDISGTGNPVTLQYEHGGYAGDFTWVRQQEQLLFGRKFVESNIRLFSYFETYTDHIAINNQANAGVYTQAQYRVRPVVIFGRSELTNYLEQGQEITLAPTTANFFNQDLQYSTFVASYKRTLVSGNTNYAGFFSGGTMSSAPVPYQFRLGGYDTVRGFSTNRAIGTSYIQNSLEYRPFLTRFQAPVMHWIGEVVVQGCVFQDAAVMWDSNDYTGNHPTRDLALVSQGAGIRLNFLKFTAAIVRLDVARTMTPSEGWGASFGVGQFF